MWKSKEHSRLIQSTPPTFRNPPKSNSQLMPAGQHGFGHRKLVRHARPIDILHHAPHHVQLLYRKARKCRLIEFSRQTRQPA